MPATLPAVTRFLLNCTQVFIPPLSSASWLPQTPSQHCWSLSEKADWVSLQLLPLPSLTALHWPVLFAAQGHEEDILPILQPLSLIEMGSKTRLQKKSLLWAALLEENESPKQIGFRDLRQTSLFILHNPV